MGISEKIKGLSNSAQEGTKNAFLSFTNIFLRLLSAFFIGLTFALVGQELMGFGSFAFTFFMLIVIASVFKLLSPWSIAQILIFDLICVLIGAVLRMYILVAP